MNYMEIKLLEDMVLWVKCLCHAYVHTDKADMLIINKSFLIYYCNDHC